MECRESLITKIEVPSTNSNHSHPEAIKENVSSPSRYTYGPRRSYREISRGKNGHPTTNAPPTKNYVTQRLPLPKNAVLLSLIQASEPARRRHAEEILPPVLPTSLSEEEGKDQSLSTTSTTNKGGVKYNKPSPLFVENNATSPVSVHFEDPMYSMLDHDDEEHKIRVGAYLEGGPCGTYAVAAKTGLLVYPTLFEHSLQNDEEDGVSRDVENMVKNSYRNKFFSKKNKGERKRGCGLPRSASCAATHGNGLLENSTTSSVDKSQIVTLVEDPVENVVEAQFALKSPVPEETDEESLRGEAMSDPGGSIPATIPSIGALTKKGPQQSSLPTRSIDLENDTSVDPALSATLKLRRQFSLGSGVPAPGSHDPEFDRSLIRLKYGDRVQVVSMDSRGWVKLARGYGYIRLENDKQLVKGMCIFLWLKGLAELVSLWLMGHCYLQPFSL
jgi:hypothetical protein